MTRPASGGAGRLLLPWVLVVAVLALSALGALVGALTAPTSPRALVLPSLSSPIQAAPTVDGKPAVTGPLRATGGPFLRDAQGRVVFLRGVNVVYKRPPFEVYPSPGKPWNFSAADASLMARLGFNVVRLGMTWRGLEPGTAPANDPAICTPGPPANPHQYNRAVLRRYLQRLKQTVDLLARFHIFTILDMHQDVYNERFDGEGAPNWAVCTTGVSNADPPGRWSRNYGTAAAGTAYEHFWDNNVVGNLQGQYDFIWGQVAAFFSSDPWVIGFDPFNEPFSISLVRLGNEKFDAELRCFYTGRASTLPGSSCPPQDPMTGVIPTLLHADPKALVFDEPDNYASRGYPTFLGPMGFPNLVFNFHVYCGARSPKTGNPTNLASCAHQETRTLHRRQEDLKEMASVYQRSGPAWFMSEFGATADPSLLASITADADARLVGWAYWSWRYYADPTGSAAEALVMADGRLRSTAKVLSRVYAEAVAGTPISMSFDPHTGRFTLVYRPDRQARAPTVVVVPTDVHYPNGYCASVSGARVLPGSTPQLVVVAGARRGLVHLTIVAGHCA